MKTMKNQKRIYLDYAATTPLDPRVGRAMRLYERAAFGNPSSIHAEGVRAAAALLEARRVVALSFQSKPEEVIFTAGGTEANNLAILGVAEALGASRGGVQSLHFIATAIEHGSVHEPLRALLARGAAVTFVPVSERGVVRAEDILAAIRPTTALISVMYVNNEIGTVQPVAKVARLLRARYGALRETIGKESERPLFHTDASQAPRYLTVSVERLGVDLLTIDGHKMYGPKGVGALFVRRGTPLRPLLHGGGQERGFRSTTENVPAIVGLAAALRIAGVEREEEKQHLAPLRDYLIPELRRLIPGAVLNGDTDECVPGIINISIPGTDTEFIAIALDDRGIAVSTKSACRGREEGSSVVRALSGDDARSRSTLRFSLGCQTTRKDIDVLLSVLPPLVRKSLVDSRGSL
ncbi:MAG: cysteine desulfurase [Parcubacteria group bacterium Gr01-1014_72]|nr:MAG: cysteine desulfurase [Parcubacteria group bacterium Gr01-1014_72]